LNSNTNSGYQKLGGEASGTDKDSAPAPKINGSKESSESEDDKKD